MWDKDRLSIVYAIESRPDVYVGITARTLEVRLAFHRYESQSSLAVQLLDREHDALTLESDIPWEDRLAREEWWHQYYRDQGWNVISLSPLDVARRGGDANTNEHMRAMSAIGNADREGHSERSRQMWAARSPEVAKATYQPGLQTWLRRRTCDVCGLESTGAGMSSHQRTTDHTGWTYCSNPDDA